jgi:soluble lytic murein transglycosylase-like protein
MAPRYGLDPNLVLAMIQTESAFDASAVSPRNARGLMQLIPETATEYGVGNPFDVDQNLTGGMKYLRWLLAYYQGDLTLVLAAYNAGAGAVDRAGGVPPFDETRDYVDRIRRIYGHDTHPFKAGLTPPSAILGQRQLAALE